MSHNSKELKKSIREAREIPKKKDPFKYDVIVDPRGQWDHPGQITKIPSNNITMKGVGYPVFGIDDLGNQQMMYPGMDYTFPGQSVTEYPMAQDGFWMNGDKQPFSLKPPVDKRQIPQSGMVVDKRTNQAYYFGDKGETGNFPVLTGQKPNVNENTYNLDYLSKHPEGRGTPTGYYMMNTPGAAMHPSISKEYDGRVRNLNPISAFGVPAPKSKDIAAHWTYGFHDDPKEYKRREKLYDCPPGSRWTTYGCVNMQSSSFDELSKAIPTSDTMMVLDSKNYADKVLLDKAKGRMIKKKQNGGWLDAYEDDDIYQEGGQSIVNYLAGKGEKYSKEARQKLAEEKGIKNYDFSAAKNIELLNKLKQEQAAPKVVTPPAKGINSYYNPQLKPMGSETTQRIKINPSKKALTQEDSEFMKLPFEQRKAIKLNKLSQQNPKDPDLLQATEEQGLGSKTWDAVSHPFTAATNLYKYGRLPNNFTQGPRNDLDLAADVINPATYINAAARTAKAATTGKTYTDIPKALGSLAVNLAGDEAPSDWNEAGMSTAGVAGDALLAMTGLKGVKDARVANRNAKFNNTLTVGKGDQAQTFNNSAEWLKAYQEEVSATGPRALSKKEINFLNKEIKQRGVLEVQRRHPLNPLSAASKALIVPEDYNFGAVLKNLPKNAWETLKHGTPEANYTMGHGRTAGWNNYLGMPTKNNPYRIHPESFTGGKDLTYTIPDAELQKLQGAFDEQIMPKQGIRQLLINKEGVSKSKAFNEKAYNTIAKHYKEAGWDKEMISAELGPKSKFKYNPKTDPNAPDWSNMESSDVYRTGDWDRYAGSHGGVGWKAEKIPGSKNTKWSMEDTWDINPFSRKENLPKVIQRLNAGKLLGGKDYHTQLDYIVSPTGHKITPMIPKEYGGSTEFEEEDDYRHGGQRRLPRNRTSKNIATSLNFLQLRNHTIFGPSGKHNIYDPSSKFEDGGSNNWLEKYK